MKKLDIQRAVAEAAQHIGTPNKAFAELITEMVEPQHVSFEVFRQFLPVRTLNKGDTLSRKARRGRYKGRTMVPGAQHLTDATYFQSQFTYTMQQLIAGTHLNLLEVKSGELGTLEEIKSAVRSDLIDDAVSKVFNLMTTVWTASNTPAHYIDASSTGLTQTSLDVGLETVLESLGSAKAIIGTRKALLPLYKFSGFVDVLLANGTTRQALPLNEVLLEYWSTGKVSSYVGVPIIDIPQISANTLPTLSRKLIRDDIVLIVGEDAGQIIQYAEFEEQEHIDTSKQPADYQYHTWNSWGVLVDRPEGVVVIKTAP